jgi:Transposase DDE domain
MNLETKYPILVKLLSPFRRSQQKTCLAIVAAILEAAQANSFAIAAELASQSEVDFPSAVTRFYRFLRNERFDNWLLTERLFSFFADRKRIVLCLDWTGWGERFSVLTASVCIEKRSIPVAVSAVKKRLLTRSQNLWEETFLRLCVERLKRARIKAVWLCDRGFHRVEWLCRLKQFKQAFVVRLQRDVLAEIDGRKVLLKNLAIEKGEYRDFGFVRLRADGKVKVRLIGVYAEQAKEVWWLATNLKLSVEEIVGLYDRRMSIEEQFRDTKGTRFGLKLKWTQFQKGEYLERMYLLIGLAMLLWTSVGRLVEKENPKTRMRCRKKGARLSLVRIGTLFWSKVTKTVKLTTKFVKENLPLPKVRIFNWLQVQQK